ncbi:MAG: acyl-CoA reductase [Bacteroidales bacterium]|nr:acyl-CoA reductase [Bacteroidales bacterium]
MTTVPTLENRIQSFVRLGTIIKEYYLGILSETSNECIILDSAIAEASLLNPWFTGTNIHFAMSTWAETLTESNLQQWILPYRGSMDPVVMKKIAVIMAGNIPLVGMHDFICILLSGNKFIGKLSRNDSILLPAIHDLLCTIEPGFIQMVEFENEKLKGYDAVIATGSNNTARYFEYYFADVPHIIRKTRNGVAIIRGNETETQLQALGIDICQFFGLGCRSISKVYLPRGYNPQLILEACTSFSALLNDHHKYMNNYIYQKTILQMNLAYFYDNGTLIMVENDAFASPVSVVNFSYYDSIEVLDTFLEAESSNIQCIVMAGHPDGKTEPGTSQKPALWEYADGVDTLKFLIGL